MTPCNKTVSDGGEGSINLEEELSDSNLRTMAVQTTLLDQIGGSVQFGKRQDLFWLTASIIVATVVIVVSIFGKKKKR